MFHRSPLKAAFSYQPSAFSFFLLLDCCFNLRIKNPEGSFQLSAISFQLFLAAGSLLQLTNQKPRRQLSAFSFFLLRDRCFNLRIKKNQPIRHPGNQAIRQPSSQWLKSCG